VLLPTMALPSLFVLDHDRKSLDNLLSDLLGRFGKDFSVQGKTSSADALEALHGLAAAHAQVALFIMIGGEPHTQWLPDDIARDPQGYTITGRDLPDSGERTASMTGNR
jgi:hypothetical protein